MTNAEAIFALERRRRRAAEELTETMRVCLESGARRRQLEEEIGAIDRAVERLTKDPQP